MFSWYGKIKDLSNDIGGNIVDTKFTQIAIYEKLMRLYPELEIDLFVFITKEAKEKNYLNYEEGGQYHIGLEENFHNRWSNQRLHPIPISSDLSQEGNWGLFHTILEMIEENDTVFFDMTHGFRSIPFTFFFVLQYAKYLRNIRFG